MKDAKRKSSAKSAFVERTDTGYNFVSLTYEQLLVELTNRVENGSSGTLYIRSDCNHAISFSLASGRIIALYFGPRRGRKAIPLILDITGGSCRFENSGSNTIPQDLPPSQEIMTMLQSNAAASKAKSGPQSGGTPDSGSEVSRENLEKLRSVLTDHLGPIAGIIFEEALANLNEPRVTQDNFQGFIDNLALSVEPDETSRFYEQVAGILRDATKG